MHDQKLSWNDYVRLCLSYTSYYKDENDAWIADVTPLPGCVTSGESRAEAAAMAEDAIHGWLVLALRFGDEIPRIDGYSLVYLENVPTNLELVHA